MRRLAIGLAVWTALAASSVASAQSNGPDWNKPVDPFRVTGNVYYVGTNELAVYLITTSAGHVLIDGGLPESAPLILTSIRRLGFKVEDVRVLLTTQAHFDHVGSLAEVAKASHGDVEVMAGDARLVEQGGRGDYLFGDKTSFTPVKVGRVLHDGDTVTVGDATLTAHATPGHTPGCTTWTMNVEDGGKTLLVLFAGSTTVNPGTRLLKDPSYPGIRGDYERSFAVLNSLHPDVFLGAHTGFFGFEDKRARQLSGAGPNPFVDPEGYRALLVQMKARFDAYVANEEKEGK